MSITLSLYEQSKISELKPKIISTILGDNKNIKDVIVLAIEKEENNFEVSLIDTIKENETLDKLVASITEGNPTDEEIALAVALQQAENTVSHGHIRAVIAFDAGTVLFMKLSTSDRILN